jgi:hypothetical protein
MSCGEDMAQMMDRVNTCSSLECSFNSIQCNQLNKCCKCPKTSVRSYNLVFLEIDQSVLEFVIINGCDVQMGHGSKHVTARLHCARQTQIFFTKRSVTEIEG